MEVDEYKKEIDSCDQPFKLVAITWGICIDTTLSKEERNLLIDYCVERYNVIKTSHEVN